MGPLWIPKGNVRAIIALVMVVGYVATTGKVDKDLVMLILGFYFGSKVREDDAERFRR